MLPYLILRLRLLGRLLRELGWLRLVLFVPLLAFTLLQALAALRGQPRAAWLVPPLVAWTLLSAHRQRADTQFLAGATPDLSPLAGCRIRAAGAAPNAGAADLGAGRPGAADPGAGPAGGLGPARP
ncbi:MAG: hypothetical protein WKG07_14905 [Hymenobacter sp.]